MSVHLADLIQEANLALLASLKETAPQEKNDTWMRGRIRSGILHASGKSSSDHKRRGRKTVRSGYGGGIYPHISGRKDPSGRTGGAETGLT